MNAVVPCEFDGGVEPSAEREGAKEKGRAEISGTAWLVYFRVEESRVCKIEERLRETCAAGEGLEECVLNTG